MLLFWIRWAHPFCFVGEWDAARERVVRNETGSLGHAKENFGRISAVGTIPAGIRRAVSRFGCTNSTRSATGLHRYTRQGDPRFPKARGDRACGRHRSEEHTSELQS